MPNLEQISVKQAAELLDFTPHYIRKLLREGKIRGGRVAGHKNLLIDSASLDAYKKTDEYSTDIDKLKEPMPITIKEAVEDVEDLFETDLIAHVASLGHPAASINHDDCIILDDLLVNLEPRYPGEKKKFKRITLYLHSGGGILEAAIKFTEIIKHYAEEFDVIVPMMAKSAASMISLAADHLYLTTVSELGPIDPVVHSPTNPEIQVTARSIDDLMRVYSREQRSTDTDHQSDIDKIILSKIENLDIYLLGSYKSALKFSEDQVRERLSRKISNDETLLDKAIEEFTTKHASHSFPITQSKLHEYGLGELIEDNQKLKVVKTLLGVYQGFMAGNNIVKTTGNRNMNRNIILKSPDKNQVPTRTSI